MQIVTKDGYELPGVIDQIRNRAVFTHSYGVLINSTNLPDFTDCQLVVENDEPRVLHIKAGNLIFDGIMAYEGDVAINTATTPVGIYYVYAALDLGSGIGVYTLSNVVLAEEDLIKNPFGVGYVCVGRVEIKSDKIEILNSTDSVVIEPMKLVTPMETYLTNINRDLHNTTNWELLGFTNALDNSDSFNATLDGSRVIISPGIALWEGFTFSLDTPYTIPTQGDYMVALKLSNRDGVRKLQVMALSPAISEDIPGWVSALNEYNKNNGIPEMYLLIWAVFNSSTNRELLDLRSYIPSLPELADKVSDLAGTITDTGWKTLPLASGYQAHSFGYAPQFKKVGKQVFLRGVFSKTNSSVIDNDVVFGTLPINYRPAFPIYAAVRALAGKVTTIQIDANGSLKTMTSTAFSPNPTWVSIDNISFWID